MAIPLAPNEFTDGPTQTARATVPESAQRVQQRTIASLVFTFILLSRAFPDRIDFGDIASSPCETIASFSVYCTVSGAKVREFTRDPDAAVPVTVMRYCPAGVPGLGLPPQASWRTRPAATMQVSAGPIRFVFLLFRFEPKPAPVMASPKTGSQKA